MRTKILASTLACTLALPALLGGALVLAPAIADAAEQATCRIHAVEASQTGDGTIPKDLEFLRDQLQAPEFARYKGFRLLDAKDFQLEVGTVVDQKFKSGHNVKLSLLGNEDGKLEFHTELMRSGSSLINMDFTVKDGQLMLIPVRRGEQAIIFAYQCKQ